MSERTTLNRPRLKCKEMQQTTDKLPGDSFGETQETTRSPETPAAERLINATDGPGKVLTVRKPVTFTTLPTSLLLTPRIAGRNATDPDALNLITIAAAGSLVVLAQMQRAEDRHVTSWKGGGDGIEDAKEQVALNREVWRTRRFGDRKKKGGKPQPANYENAGRQAYRTMTESLKDEPLPPTVTMRVTKSAILRAARMSANSTNLSALSDALERLQRPIFAGSTHHPPLIKAIESNGTTLCITIDTWWLLQLYKKLPLPLPAKSPLSLRLYLFLYSLKSTHGGNKLSSRLSKLAERMGIEHLDRWHRLHALRKALELVNALADKHPKSHSRFDMDVSRGDMHGSEDEVLFTRTNPRIRQDEEDGQEVFEKERERDRLRNSRSNVREPGHLDDEARLLSKASSIINKKEPVSARPRPILNLRRFQVEASERRQRRIRSHRSITMSDDEQDTFNSNAEIVYVGGERWIRGD